MRLVTLATLALGVAAGYMGARALMERDTALPEELPSPRARVTGARAGAAASRALGRGGGCWPRPAARVRRRSAI